MHQLLSRGVDHGLQSEAEYPGKAASDHVMSLCLSRPIETEKTNLLEIAEHTSALAEIIVWCLRTGPAWQHPKPLKLGEHIWQPACYAIPGGLRRIVLCDHWSERRALQEARDWQTLEGALYGLPVTIIAVVLGAMRDGRRHGPLSKGYLHPRSGDLRFKKRDGNDFGENWDKVFRESNLFENEQWIEAMSADGVMEETFLIQPPVEFDADQSREIAEVAKVAMDALAHPDIYPVRRSLSSCFDSIHPCEFRHPCSYFHEPEIGKGFISVPGRIAG